MRERVHHKLGLSLIILSSLMWGAISIVPIFPLALTQKGLISTGLILTSELIFWLGILLSSKELAHRYPSEVKSPLLVAKSRQETKIVTHSYLHPPSQ